MELRDGVDICFSSPVLLCRWWEEAELLTVIDSELMSSPMSARGSFKDELVWSKEWPVTMLPVVRLVWAPY